MHVIFIGSLLAAAATAAAPRLAPLLGTAWYPEQWPEAQWDKDLALMEAGGIGMVRVGEFAWSSLEPEEGRYELDWLERAISEAAAHHIVVVLGTPTDAPPAWLTQKYPGTLRVDASGRRAGHGNRRQFSYTSPRYRELSRAIVEKLAVRFGHNSNVIGWQIGNEYTEDSFDDYTRLLFQRWLQAKYRTLDSLNRHWATAYWSETYTRWDQVPLPAGRDNPGLLLDYHSFVTDAWRDFQRNQLEAIRAHAGPRQFITTNFGGLAWTDRFDHYAVAADLDLAAWDDYVGEGHLEPDRNGAMDDLARGWKRRNFWVMEAQPGAVDWAAVSNSLDKGETRAMAWEDVGHGADCIGFWQWRSALNGQEQYHGALAGPDGEPVPIYGEIRQLGREFAETVAALTGTRPVSQVAILHDYPSRWAIDIHPQTRRYDQLQVLLDYYRPLERLAQSVDIVDPESPLGGYRVVFAPGLNVIPEALAPRLVEYVRRGGHLVLGPRSGMKDAYNSLYPERQPGPLVEPLGGRVEQYYALLDPVPVSGPWGDGEASIWAELLSARAPDTAVLLRYGPANGWLDGQPAVLSRRIGKGRLTYIGALLDPALMRRVIASMLNDSGVRPAFGPVPEGIEACRRIAPDREIFVLINHRKQPQTVPLPAAMRSLLEGGARRASVMLPPQGVAVLERARP